MKKAKSQDKAAQSKEHIVLVAMRLFSTRGYHKTSTQAICDAAGISTGLLFYHFGSKENLLKSIVKMTLSKIDETLEHNGEEDPAQLLENIIDAFFDSLKEHSQYWDLYMALLYQPDTKAQIVEEVSEHSTKFRRRVFELMEKMGRKDPAGDSFEFEVFRVGSFASYLANHNEKLLIQARKKIKERYLNH